MAGLWLAGSGEIFAGMEATPQTVCTIILAWQPAPDSKGLIGRPGPAESMRDAFAAIMGGGSKAVPSRLKQP